MFKLDVQTTKMRQSTKFFYAKDGKQVGPHSLNEISELIFSGIIQPETLMWKKGLNEWTQAKSLTEISKYFGEVPPPLMDHPKRKPIKSVLEKQSGHRSEVKNSDKTQSNNERPYSLRNKNWRPVFVINTLGILFSIVLLVAIVNASNELDAPSTRFAFVLGPILATEVTRTFYRRDNYHFSRPILTALLIHACTNAVTVLVFATIQLAYTSGLF